MVRLRSVCLAVILAAAMPGCAPTLVAPYSSDLQKRASDMTGEVSAWERSMTRAAGTVAADPRHPDVQAQFDAWNGTIDAMTAIAVSLDPKTVRCDAITAKVGEAIRPLLPDGLRDSMPPAAPASATAGAAAKPPAKGCEVVMFEQMRQDLDLIDKLMQEQCKLPWLDDAYFKAMAENRAAAGGPGPSAASGAARVARPAPKQQADAVEKCGAIFGGGNIAANGLAVTPLLRDLRTVVYVEGRKKPTDASK